MVLEIEGQAAHSGGAFEKGISAIGELAHKIVAIHALTDLKRGVTLNVGLVSGGQSVNTTAPHARRRNRLALCHADDRASTLAAIEAIVATSTVPGATARLTIRGEFLPLVATPEAEILFAGYQVAGRMSDLRLRANFPAAAPIPVLLQRRVARRCVRPDRLVETRIRTTNILKSISSFHGHRLWRWRSCACRAQLPEVDFAFIGAVPALQTARRVSRSQMRRLHRVGVQRREWWPRLI